MVADLFTPSNVKSTKLVSVVMPAFNCAFTIERSVNSLLQQSYPFWELIIVDDFSSDDTWSLILRLSSLDSRIRAISNSENKGPAFSRNLAIDLSNGDLIAFLDADDTWHPDKLLVQVENHKIFSFMSYDHVDSSGKFLATVIPPPLVTYEDLIQKNTIGLLTVMLDKTFIGALRFPNCRHEDYGFWIMLLKSNDYAVRVGGAKSFASYTKSSNSLSSNKIRAFWWHYKILNDFTDLCFFRRIMCMIKYAIYAFKKHYIN